MKPKYQKDFLYEGAVVQLDKEEFTKLISSLRIEHLNKKIIKI